MPPDTAPAPSGRLRVRIRFAKLGKVRFTSHRDTARIWERALRRAELPVSYTEGFSPRPRLSFGLALPTGAESLAEYLDIDLDVSGGAIAADEVVARLAGTLPVGFEVHGARLVETGETSLQEAVVACTWAIELTGDPDALTSVAAAVVAAPTLEVVRERKGKEHVEDLRAALERFEPLAPTARGMTFIADLATQPRAMRPSDLGNTFSAHLPDTEVGWLRRTQQWTMRAGERCEPVPGPAPDGRSLAALALSDAPLEVARAS